MLKQQPQVLGSYNFPIGRSIILPKRKKPVRVQAQHDAGKDIAVDKTLPVGLRLLPQLLTDQRWVGVTAVVVLVEVATLAQQSLCSIATAAGALQSSSAAAPDALAWPKQLAGAAEAATASANDYLKEVQGNFDDAFAELKRSAEAVQEQVDREVALGAVNWEKTVHAVTTSFSAENSRQMGLVAMLTEAENHGTQQLAEMLEKLKKLADREAPLQSGWGSSVLARFPLQSAAAATPELVSKMEEPTETDAAQPELLSSKDAEAVAIGQVTLVATLREEPTTQQWQASVAAAAVGDLPPPATSVDGAKEEEEIVVGSVAGFAAAVHAEPEEVEEALAGVQAAAAAMESEEDAVEKLAQAAVSTAAAPAHEQLEKEEEAPVVKREAAPAVVSEEAVVLQDVAVGKGGGEKETLFAVSDQFSAEEEVENVPLTHEVSHSSFAAATVSMLSASAAAAASLRSVERVFKEDGDSRAPETAAAHAEIEMEEDLKGVEAVGGSVEAAAINEKAATSLQVEGVEPEKTREAEAKTRPKKEEVTSHHAPVATAASKLSLDTPSLVAITEGGRHISFLTAPMSIGGSSGRAGHDAAAAVGKGGNKADGTPAGPEDRAPNAGMEALRRAAPAVVAAAVLSGGGGEHNFGGDDGGKSGGGGRGNYSGGGGDGDAENSGGESWPSAFKMSILAMAVVAVGALLFKVGVGVQSKKKGAPRGLA